MQTHTRVLHDGAKNLLVLVRGSLFETGVIESLDKVSVMSLDLREISPAFRRLRLEAVTWFIQEKCGLGVWLSERDRDPGQLLLVLESRGWSKFQDFVLPDGWDGRVWLEPFGAPSFPSQPGLFWLSLDFDKVG